MTAAARRRARGTATVEMAVAMIVIVPITLYTLFLNDLLLYNLDWQEAVVTPAWDAAPLDFPRLSIATEAAARIQSVDRKVFCDHTSAYDSFDKGFDCNDERHHQAMAAHQCWLAGGKQITCGVNETLGVVEPSYGGRFNRGGLVSCTARLGVQNYFIPQRFLSWGVNLTRTEKFSGGAHGNAGAATTGNSWVFGAQGGGGSGSSEAEGEDGVAEAETDALPPGTTASDDFFAVLHDPWALNHLATILPDDGQTTGHALYDRVEHYYYSGNVVPEAKPAVDGADAYAGRLQALGALGATANTVENPSAMGDKPTIPNIAFIAAKDMGSATALGSVHPGASNAFIDMYACYYHGCPGEPLPPPPADLGQLPVDPHDPVGGPGGPGTGTPISNPGGNFNTSGNTAGQNAAVNTPIAAPPPVVNPPPQNPI